MPNSYNHLSKEDLLKVIEKLESRKRYGLIWDEDRTKEQFEKESENALPVLKEVKGKEIKTDSSKTANILIEGDNYHCLSVLNYTHQGKIDLIYIDPPYNTGNRDFKYNDCWVDREDSYRHSMWLSFMSKRLRLAQRLLKDSGVIFISIDDNEVFQLKILCDEIFGDNFIACLPTIMNLKGNNDQFGFAGTHEYTLVYMKNKDAGIIRQFELDEEVIDDDWNQDEYGYFKKGANLKATGVNAPRKKRPNLFFPIFITKKNDFYVTEDGKLPKDRKGKGDQFLFPITDGKEMTWRWSKQKISNEKHNIIVVKNDNGEISLYKKQRPSLGDLPSKKPKSLFYKPEYSSGNGTALLKSMFNKEKIFNNPKPVDLVKDFIFIGGNKDCVVLDFMAGSGTTGHAVLDLNKADNGNRVFILCTNDEENICTDVCYPRLQKAIIGYKTPKGAKIEGLGGNLKYFKTSFVKRMIGKDSLKVRITRECTEMLCLREGIFEEIKKTDDYRIFQHNNHIMGVYYSLERSELKSLKKDLDKMKGEKILYCFTLDPLGLDRSDFEGWQDVSLEPIPQKILDVYEDIYEY
jgi:adenine-specific DNA-methyltransferase